MRPPRLALPFVLSATLHAALVTASPFDLPERPVFVPPPIVEEVAELGPINVGVYEEPAPEPVAPPPPAPPIAAERVTTPAPPPPAVAEEKAIEAAAEPAKKVERERKKLVKRATRRDKKPVCGPPSEDIARVGEAAWTIERPLIEHYATHLKELMKLGWVAAHETDGKPDGFRVGLARCSVLREGGLRSGDVVHDINGRKVNNLVQAVAAYFALRKEETLTVNLTRGGKRVAMTYHIEGEAGRAKPIRLKDLR